jgi:hypothetical protein
LGISGMNGNEGYWGGGISTVSQNFIKSPSILFHPLESSISETSPEGKQFECENVNSNVKMFAAFCCICDSQVRIHMRGLISCGVPCAWPPRPGRGVLRSSFASASRGPAGAAVKSRSRDPAWPPARLRGVSIARRPATAMHSKRSIPRAPDDWARPD